MLIKDTNKKRLPPKINFVIGLGISGFWVAQYLHSKGKSVIVLEASNNKLLSLRKKELEEKGIKVFLEKPFQYEYFAYKINQIESLIISPGINLDNENVLKLKKDGVNIIGEVNIGWNNLKHINWVGITGTNGKSTVTKLLSHLLSKNNIFAPSAGNIGTPLCKLAYDLKNSKTINWIIAELSSYQLEIANEIEPKIGIWTTFTADHLDRHKTLRNYFDIKNNLLKNSKTKIYNYDDQQLRDSYKYLDEGIWITTTSENNNVYKCDYWIDKEGFIIERGIRLFNLKSFKLKGNHNIQNLLLATAAARKIGLSELEISTSLLSFEQLPHRLETIFKNNSLEIINDSKATNYDSSIAGINSISLPHIIISGGRIKEGNPEIWIETAINKGYAIFLYGEGALFLKEILINGGFKREIFIFKNLLEVIKEVILYALKKKIKTILFSPSCSSFDQFKNYEERGKYFKKLVENEIMNIKSF